MAEITLTVLCNADDRLTVRLDAGTAPQVSEVLGPPPELVGDLCGQLRSSRMAGAAARHLADLLGRVLFAGEPGEALRAALHEDHEVVILLATDPRLAEWPWELARDPDTGAAPVLEGALFVRESGAPADRATASRRAVLVVPGEHAAAHVGTLQAATRPLGRKLGVDVFPVEPVTGPGLRRTLARGALFVHIEAALEGDALVLDDGHVPVERIGVDRDTWLVVFGGPEATLSLHPRLRGLGVPLVLGLQMPLETAAAAALDRELYRALASGESVGDALRRARRALVRFGGAEGVAWAAPVLWSAPGVHGTGSPALRPFPPPATAEEKRDPGATLLDFQALRLGGGTTQVMAAVPGRPEPTGPATLPLSAPVFIQDTIRAVREGRQDPDLQARVEGLRLLGGTVTVAANDAELAELSPSERTTRLADRLVETISRPDAELTPPADLETRVRAAARGAGIDPEHLGRLARALLCGRGLVLAGGDANERRRVLRVLAEEVFEYAVLVPREDAPDRFLGGPAEAGFGGFVYEALAMNWRRDELEPFRLDATGPTQRIPVVGRAAGRYRVLRGVWVLAAADNPELRASLRDAGAALEEGSLSGLAGARPYRLRLPSDFRLLLSVSSAASLRGLLPASLPVIGLNGAGPVAEAFVHAERERWLGEADARCGPAVDVADSQARLRIADLLGQVLTRLHPAGLGTSPFASAMVMAVQSPGTPEARVDAALAAFLAARVTPAQVDQLGLPLPALRSAATLLGQS